jgi:D-alanine transaminase
LAESNSIPSTEADISEDRLMNADEVWITSSTREIVSVTEINGSPVAEGKPGPLSIKMLSIYNEYKAKLMRGGAE